jgi:hypothetical protein
MRTSRAARSARSAPAGRRTPRRARRRRSAGAVARIDKGLVAPLALGVVESVEVATEHQHLAAHLEATRHGALEPQRDRADGAQVGRDVLADRAVAARGALDEAAVLVAQADREAVELQLGAVAQRGEIEAGIVGGLAHTAVEGAHLLVLEGIEQREHRQRVPDLPECADRRATDPTGRGVGRIERRERGLERLQLAEQAVVLGVGHRRRVEHVVGVIVALELGAQLLDARTRGVCALFDGEVRRDRTAAWHRRPALS